MWRTGLRAVLGGAGALLAACQPPAEAPTDRRSGPATIWEPVAGSGGAAGGSPPLMPFPSDGSDAAVVPGMMPPVQDAGTVSGEDAAAPSGSTDAAVDLSSCAPPPAGASTTAIRAWTMINELRLAAGAGCMHMVAALNASAQAHCDYLATNASNPACDAGAHGEVAGCPGFTGTDVQSREVAAGYPQQLAYTEVALSYGDNPELAIPGWLVTPYHRIPLIDPWTTDMGWGGGPDCDVIDIGRGNATVPDSTVLVYPYAGQTDVPPTFNGLEAPAPPQPAGGWPSSYPVSIYARQLSVTEHLLMKDGSTTPLPHTWLDSNNPGSNIVRPYFGNTAILYGAAFEPNTTYRVRIVGSYAGGALEREWTFTTGATQPPWF